MCSAWVSAKVCATWLVSSTSERDCSTWMDKYDAIFHCAHTCVQFGLFISKSNHWSVDICHTKAIPMRARHFSVVVITHLLYTNKPKRCRWQCLQAKYRNQLYEYEKRMEKRRSDFVLFRFVRVWPWKIHFAQMSSPLSLLWIRIYFLRGKKLAGKKVFWCLFM